LAAGNSDLLARYRQKRDFGKTPEPTGGKAESREETIFVIQKHAARRLHYDFRLEVDGVLKSWAVPKGPSTNPKDKRLAMPTEDHPMEYACFEGVIPEGEYGAGVVIVWDIGSYQNVTVESGACIPPNAALEKGRLVFSLAGKKLRGDYSLVRIGAGAQERWILTKRRDDYADDARDILSEEPRSVLTGRTIEQVARGD